MNQPIIQTFFIQESLLHEPLRAMSIEQDLSLIGNRSSRQVEFLDNLRKKFHQVQQRNFAIDSKDLVFRNFIG
jgi:hypothetical protein